MLPFPSCIRLLLLGVVIAAVFFGLRAYHAASIPLGSSHLTPIDINQPYITATCTLTPTHDTWGVSTSGGSNYGTEQDMQIGFGSNGARRRVFIRFDLSECDLGQDAVVLSATLRLYRNSTNINGTRNYRSSRITQSWDETTLTYSNQPATTTGAEDNRSYSNTGSPDWREWTVTTHVQGFLDGSYTNYGWMLWDTGSTPASGSNTAWYSTKEASSNNPELVITYQP